MLVKITLEDGNHFLTTLSPNPLPLRPTGMGYRNHVRDLEIDPSFAKQLRISAYKTEVGPGCNFASLWVLRAP